MFALIEILLVPAAWFFGKVFAGYFPGSRPPKLYAVGFGLVVSALLFALFATFRYWVAGWLFNDASLGIQVEWFGPLDPPAIFLYAFFAYGGAVSFYKPSKS